MGQCVSGPDDRAPAQAQPQPLRQLDAVLQKLPATSTEVPATRTKSSARLHPKPPPPSPQVDANDPLAAVPQSRYKKLRTLNVGSSGFVQLAEDLYTDQEKVAIKFLERGTKLIRNADREICNLRLCCMHPYIIRFKQAFLTEEHLAIVSEYAPLGDLADYIDDRRQGTDAANGGLPENQARQLFQHLVIAVDFCHAKGIVNRDLKLENVLLMPDRARREPGAMVAKLCDFGFSKDEAIDSICHTACGTPEYVAPEILLSQSQKSYSGKAADMWSLGVMLYVMLTGTYPFREESDHWLPMQAKLKVMFPRIVRGQFKRPEILSTCVITLLEGLLYKDPDVRFTVTEVMDHPWFREGLPSGAEAINKNLLQISDMLLTSFVAQSEDQILGMCQSAMQTGATSRPGQTPGALVPQAKPAPREGHHAHAPAINDSASSLRVSIGFRGNVPRRWSMNANPTPSPSPSASPQPSTSSLLLQSGHQLAHLPPRTPPTSFTIRPKHIVCDHSAFSGVTPASPNASSLYSAPCSLPPSHSLVSNGGTRMAPNPTIYTAPPAPDAQPSPRGSLDTGSTVPVSSSTAPATHSTVTSRSPAGSVVNSNNSGNNRDNSSQWSSFSYDDVIVSALNGSDTPRDDEAPISPGHLRNAFAQVRAMDGWVVSDEQPGSPGSMSPPVPSTPRESLRPLKPRIASPPQSPTPKHQSLSARRQPPLPAQPPATRPRPMAKTPVIDNSPAKMPKVLAVSKTATPFALVQPSKGGEPVSVPLPPAIAADPYGLASNTPDRSPPSVRMASGTTSIGSASLDSSMRLESSTSGLASLPTDRDATKAAA